MKIRFALAGLLVGSLGLSGPSWSQDAIGGGSPFPAVVYQKWIEMAKADANLSIIFDTAGGAPAGQNRLLAREIDFAVSGLPMPESVRTTGGVQQFPVLVGAIVPIVNLPGVASTRLKLNGALLAKIYTGGIRKWNDPAIVAINPDLTLPDLEIRPVSLRDGGLAASYGFTQYILAADADWRARHGDVVTKRWAIGSTVEDPVSMAETIKVLPGSIGYMPYGVAAKMKMPMVSLLNKAGHYVSPSLEGIAAATNNANWQGATDLVMTLVNQPGDTAWPISQTSYAQTPIEPKDPARRRAVLAFFDFAYRQGGSVLAEYGFVPLPETVQNRVRAQWARPGS